MSQDLAEFDTELTADVVEWRPISNNDKENIKQLVCGTYYLNAETRQRQGRLYYFDFNTTTNDLTQNDVVNYCDSGILDLKWLNSSKLATIDSNNILKIFQTNNSKFKLETEMNLNQSDETDDAIGLTLDFLKQKSSSNCFKILTGDSKGKLNLVRLENENINLIETIHSCDYEVWSVLIDRNHSDLIYSGADDSILKMWDVRESGSKDKASKQWINIFGAGVCSIIQPDRLIMEGYSLENNLICGSYDEKIYILDKRNTKRSVKESNKLNGGVWKIKLHPVKDLFLCACMHTGVHIVDTNTLTSQVYYDKHQLNTLAYGCDWSPDGTLISSCSFYNHNMRIWKMN
jgi:diphthine methyl ester acylhydrolase